MALDFGEVLTRAWKITWKHKILWAFGLVTMLMLGLGAICMAPLQLLLYPFMLVTYAWYELALASTVVDGSGVFEAARRGWQVFRQNTVHDNLLARPGCFSKCCLDLHEIRLVIDLSPIKSQCRN